MIPAVFLARSPGHRYIFRICFISALGESLHPEVGHTSI
jgi:hypothetical protein